MSRRDCEVAESYMGTEKANVWEGNVRKEVEIPYQGPRVLFCIDGGTSARDIQEYSAVPVEDEVLLPCAIAFNVCSVIGISPGMLVVHLSQLESQREQQGSYQRGSWIEMGSDRASSKRYKKS